MSYYLAQLEEQKRQVEERTGLPWKVWSIPPDLIPTPERKPTDQLVLQGNVFRLPWHLHDAVLSGMDIRTKTLLSLFSEDSREMIKRQNFRTPPAINIFNIKELLYVALDEDQDYDWIARVARTLPDTIELGDKTAFRLYEDVILGIPMEMEGTSRFLHLTEDVSTRNIRFLYRHLTEVFQTPPSLYLSIDIDARLQTVLARLPREFKYNSIKISGHSFNLKQLSMLNKHFSRPQLYFLDFMHVSNIQSRDQSSWESEVLIIDNGRWIEFYYMMSLRSRVVIIKNYMYRNCAIDAWITAWLISLDRNHDLLVVEVAEDLPPIDYSLLHNGFGVNGSLDTFDPAKRPAVYHLPDHLKSRVPIQFHEVDFTNGYDLVRRDRKRASLMNQGRYFFFAVWPDRTPA